jgi:N-acetylneuraminic acid mutarotase
MNRYLFYLAVFMLLTVTVFSQGPRAENFTWSELAPLPDSFGFAGAFAGVSNGALIVAGGANFPDGGAPWTGSKKVWSDKIFVLDRPDGKWKVAGQLPRPLGYGVSVSYNGGLLCIGGSNETGHFASVFSIRYDGRQIRLEFLPDLPGPLANSSGALVDHTLYIAGGLHHPEDTSTAKVFWSLDLSAPKEKRKWRELESWPGPARMLSVAGALSGSFFLFSGTDLKAVQGGQTQRMYLRDAYQFTPQKGWKKLADLPQAVVAAPTPAYSEDHSLFIFGGDDGALAPKAAVLKEYHPGFSNQILKYTVLKNHWAIDGKIKTDKRKDAAINPNGSTWAPVTTSLVLWKGKLVFPSGEVRPAIRTPKVLMASKKNSEATPNHPIKK